MHRADLYIVLRKLVAQIQAFSQRVYETAMVRLYSTVDPNDIVVIRQVICDSAFHVRPHPSLPRYWTKTEMCSSVPDPLGRVPINQVGRGSLVSLLFHALPDTTRTVA
jgi:hypothetical protein